MARKRGTQLTSAIGVRGEMFTEGFLKEERRVDNLTLFDYRRMCDNDGTVQMILSAIFGTILSAGFEIHDDPDVDPETESEQKIFVEKNLLSPRWKGGLSRDLDLAFRDMLRALIEGYRIFEVIYRKEGEQYLLDALSPRTVRSSENEIKIKIDEGGNFIGFRQTTTFMNQTKNVEVLNEGGINKAILAVWGEEFGSNYGRSALRPGWYHYDKAHKGMYLNHIAHEMGATKPRLVKKKGLGTDESDDKLMGILEKPYQNQVVMYSEQQYEVTYEEGTDSAVMQQGKEMIDMHNSKLAMSLLAQFLQLGSENSNTGSRSLGDTHQQLFKQGLQQVAAVLIEKPINKVISDLVSLNFDGEIYPFLKWNAINDDTVGVLYDGFIEMTKSGSLPDGVRTQFLVKASDKLGFDVSEDEITEEIEKQKEEDMAQEQSKLDAQKEIAAMRTAKPPVGLADAATTAMMQMKPEMQGEMHEHEEMSPMEMRALYPDEQKVMLVDIKRKLMTTEVSAEQVLSSKAQAQKEAIVEQYTKAVDKGTKAISSVSIKLQEGRNYGSELFMIVQEIFNFGKETAAEELGVNAPKTGDASRSRIKAKTERIIKKQEADLEYRLSVIAQAALDNRRPVNETKLLLEAEFDDFFGKVIKQSIQAFVPEMLNLGRNETFEKNLDKIYAFRYTAVLDNRTTQYCRSMDGKVFQVTDPNFAMVTPPNHYGCRSIWTPILDSEKDDVSVTGLLGGLPVFGASLNRFKDVEDITELAEKQEAVEDEIETLIHIIEEE